MQSLMRVVRSASALWPFYIAVVVVSSIVAGLGLISPFLIREATDTIIAALGDEPVPDATRTVVWLAIALFVAEASASMLHNVSGYLGDVMVARIRQILSTRYFAKLHALPQRYYDNQVTGTIIARLDRSIANVTQFIQSFTNNFLPMLLQVVAILGITAYYYWPLTVLLALLFPLYTWLTALTSKRWQVFEQEKNANIDEGNGRFAEVVGQVKVTKSYGAEVRELEKFGRHYTNTVDITRPQSRWWHSMDTARGVAMNLIFLGIYLILFTRTLDGHFTVGEMVMLIQMVTMARQPVTMMSWIVDSAQRAIAGSRDYFKVMDEPVEPTANRQLVAATEASGMPALDATQQTPLRVREPVVAFDNVTFEYMPGEPVLHDVTFTAREGEKIALVGESGGGKSTIVNLLLGLYPITRGRLEVCGEEISHLDVEKLRATTGVVFQEAALFSGSVFENIAYGKPDATMEEVVAVAKRANAHDFIMKFTDGYDTIIGERGLRLSGGQRQRVAVARAMLKDAPLLILDEATSALDTKAERAVQAGLDELMRNRTTIMIAHRLSTIAGVDTIITLRDGRIDEIGSPADLAVSGGIYSELLRLTASSSAADRKRLKAFGFAADGAEDDEYDEEDHSTREGTAD
ncbi:ABC transporter ATP-binding protein [Corynebacterium coyleae]|uniref:ABC transporter ATP-binding protein n=1 Tax=Corynebacterium coyleae TaxID=53374 RepID=UPI00254FA741|nr:ABC transporter ATP-binding protein [Corynebacterium coyleae]MDK8664236.1 ABC transporter ATP-binding protein [Corynebacterium coyleae]MDK8707288.1 ABC transporter ATP-binding protein [Corynebacterium coyleae]MDK8734070.1 ABC transporter ATP-binding protein [Corynebacterium coyleae]MDK8893333.1 ABC transporter ATP-binding protein [Corynebacterium coyleae]